jgi:hypothetical protein
VPAGPGFLHSNGRLQVRTPLLSSSFLVVAGRVLLVALAAAAVLVGFATHRRSTPVQSATYVCPMHPEVTSPSPGDCPICRMALVPKAAARPPATAGDRAAAARREGPPALTLPPGKELRGFDAVSRTKRYEIALEMRAPAAVDDDARAGVALYHVDESALVVSGEEGLFAPASGPRAGAPLGLKVRVADGPPERWDGGTVLVRFQPEPGVELHPNETGVLKLATRLRSDLVVRDSSIIQSPEGPTVLVASEDKRAFTKRPVEVGTTLYGYAAITGGLREDEYVAASHTFVLEVERRAARRTAP